jgi:DNA end-binding protein Ku
MARAILKSSIVWGMVNIPIGLYTAQREERTTFNQLCPNCEQRIKYKRWCENCNKEVDYKEIKKGYQIAKNKYVVVQKEQLDSLKAENTNIEIIKFVNGLDSILFKKSYYLYPQEKFERNYCLFRELLSLYGKVAIAKFVFRDKEHLVCIKPYKNVLLLTTLYYSYEIIPISQKVEADIKKEELELGKQLMLKMTAKGIDLSKFKNEYNEKVKMLLQNDGKMTKQLKKGVKKDDDLLKQLKKSL